MEEGKEKRKLQEPKAASGNQHPGINKRRIGAIMEARAAQYLEEQGMQILERNYRCRRGEIDLIGQDGEYLVFVEVKFRSTTGSGYAADAVDVRKQRRICRVADYYRAIHGLGDNTAVRYDVVTVQGDEITWIRNAFPHIYQRRQQGGL